MRKTELVAVAVAALAAATPAAAQGRGRGNNGVPPGHRPAAGMCRIWIDGVPPGHQPPPTDCATAELHRPANARVIYGDQTPFPGQGRHETSSNGSVVIDGRQCIQRVDRNGNVRYDCPDRTGSVLGGVLGRTHVDQYGRVVDQYGHVIDDRSYSEQHGKKAKKLKAKHHGGNGDRDNDPDHDDDDDRG